MERQPSATSSRSSSSSSPTAAATSSLAAVAARRLQQAMGRAKTRYGIQLIDSVFFVLGVLCLLITQAVVLVRPSAFETWYLWTAVPLFLWRFLHYRHLSSYKYFLLDFCYLVNAILLLQLAVFPDSQRLFHLAYGCSLPVAWAITLWRNSMVLHSVEKMTSLYIHGMPALLLFCARWGPELQRKLHGSSVAFQQALPPYLHCDASIPVSQWGWHCVSSSYTELLWMPLCFYGLWQLAYFLKTEVVDRHKLEADPELQTSFRWLTGPKGGPLRRIILSMALQLHLVKSEADFHHNSIGTKLAFMLGQLLYTAVCMLPAKLMFDSFWVSVAFLLFWLLSATWNGSQYYFGVFAKRYRQSVEEELAALLAEKAAMNGGRVGEKGHADSAASSGVAAVGAAAAPGQPALPAELTGAAGALHAGTPSIPARAPAVETAGTAGVETAGTAGVAGVVTREHSPAASSLQVDTGDSSRSTRLDTDSIRQSSPQKGSSEGKGSREGKKEDMRKQLEKEDGKLSTGSARRRASSTTTSSRTRH